MIHLIVATALSLGGAAIFSGPLSAQVTPGARVGIVLSGGGAKGFAHLGVLEVLEENGIPVHIIAGNSMGAFVGALYSIGYTTSEIREIIVEGDWNALSNDAVPRDKLPLERRTAGGRHLLELPIRNGTPGLPANLVAGQRLSSMISRLLWPARRVRDFANLPIPFGAVATDIETGDVVALRRGRLADAVRASMSIPGVLSPVTIDGHTLVDGMLIRNLPARDARDLGADFLICSDVSSQLVPVDSLHTILDVLDQVISFRGHSLRREDRALCDFLIEPATDGISAIAFDQAEEIIQRGRNATAQHLTALRQLADVRPIASKEPLPRDQVAQVEEVEFEDAGDIDRDVLLRMLDLPTPAQVTADDLDAAMERLHVTGAFRAVSYRLDPISGAATERLVVRIEGTAPDVFGFGVRYESRYKASFLLSTSLRDKITFGSITTFDLRLGQQLQAQVQHRSRFGPNNTLAWSASVGAARVPFDLFLNRRRVNTGEVDLWHASVYAGAALGRPAGIGIRLKGEHAWPRSGGPSGTATGQTYHTLSGLFRLDSRDRKALPTTGAFISAHYERSDKRFGSSLDFSQYGLQGEVHIPLSQTVSGSARLVLGGTSGTDTPPHYLYNLGGAHPYYLIPERHIPFPGLNTQELIGSHVQVVGLAVQTELFDNFITKASWLSGNAFDGWMFETGAYVHGFSVSGAFLNAGGSLQSTLAWATGDHNPVLTFDAGFPF